MFTLRDGARAGQHPKAARLAQWTVAGFPVPDGVTLERHEWTLGHPTVRRAIEDLLRQGPVIVRMALPDEDMAGGTAAGLGRSIADRRNLAEVAAALEELANHECDPWILRYRELKGLATAASAQALIQHQVRRRWLLVIALFGAESAHVEVHTRHGDVLADGATPDYSGPLDRWPFPGPRRRVLELCRRMLETEDVPEHGLEIELVMDPEENLHLVQLRPIAGELTGWQAFRDELDRTSPRPDLHGLLVLDVEHNPAPLSPAHAWLMQWLAERRPAAGNPVVLGGWLYLRTLPRELRGTDRTGELPSAVDMVTQLHETLLPRARADLDALSTRLARAGLDELMRELELAKQTFLAMIDTYTRLLIPVRQATWARVGRHPLPDSQAPLSLRSRRDYIDVLPTAWDIASPALADLSEIRSRDRPEPVSLPTEDAQAATLLGEWDDHLFALGLAPLRRVYLRAGELLDLSDDVFLLTGDELDDALHGKPIERELLATRAQARDRAARLAPPLRIFDGHPLPPPPGEPLRGIPIGPCFRGRLFVHTGLDSLLAAGRPPADAVIVLPSLTAQTAVALHDLGVRAVCCEHGGMLSHAALMARELGLSALIGCRGCTALPNGSLVLIDTRTARLVLEPSSYGEHTSNADPP